MSSSICHSFVQNAWRKDLCSNCFKSKADHDLCDSKKDNEEPSQRYIGIGLQRNYYGGSSTWKSLVLNSTSNNKLRSPSIIRDLPGFVSRENEKNLRICDLTSCRLVRQVRPASASEAWLLNELLGKDESETRGCEKVDLDLGSEASSASSSSLESDAIESDLTNNLSDSWSDRESPVSKNSTQKVLCANSLQDKPSETIKNFNNVIKDEDNVNVSCCGAIGVISADSCDQKKDNCDRTNPRVEDAIPKSTSCNKSHSGKNRDSEALDELISNPKREIISSILKTSSNIEKLKHSVNFKDSDDIIGYGGDIDYSFEENFDDDSDSDSNDEDLDLEERKMKTLTAKNTDFNANLLPEKEGKVKLRRAPPLVSAKPLRPKILPKEEEIVEKSTEDGSVPSAKEKITSFDSDLSQEAKSVSSFSESLRIEMESPFDVPSNAFGEERVIFNPPDVIRDASLISSQKTKTVNENNNNILKTYCSSRESFGECTLSNYSKPILKSNSTLEDAPIANDTKLLQPQKTSLHEEAPNGLPFKEKLQLIAQKTSGYFAPERIMALKHLREEFAQNKPSVANVNCERRNSFMKSQLGESYDSPKQVKKEGKDMPILLSVKESISPSQESRFSTFGIPSPPERSNSPAVAHSEDADFLREIKSPASSPTPTASIQKAPLVGPKGVPRPVLAPKPPAMKSKLMSKGAMTGAASAPNLSNSENCSMDPLLPIGSSLDQELVQESIPLPRAQSLPRATPSRLGFMKPGFLRAASPFSEKKASSRGARRESRPKKSRFSLRKILKFGSRDHQLSPEEGPKKERPQIIHPLDYNPIGVEVIERPPEHVPPYGGLPQVSPAPSFASSSTKSDESHSLLKKEPSSASSNNDSRPTSPHNSSSSSSHLGYNSEGRPKPPPPPRKVSLEASNLVPLPDDKSESPTRLGIVRDSVYANLGNIRAPITPMKPGRTSSIREDERRRAPPPPSEQGRPQERTSGRVSSKKPRLSKGPAPHMPPSENEGQSSHYAVSQITIGGVAVLSQENGPDGHRRSRRKVSISHQSLEEQYGSLVTATHEALSDFLDKLSTQNCPAYYDGMESRISSWSDLHVSNDTPVVVGHRFFYSGSACGRPVTLMVTPELKVESHHLLTPLPIRVLRTDVPIKYFSGVGSSVTQTGTVWVLPKTKLMSLEDYYSSSQDLRASQFSSWQKQSFLVLLQLITGLKQLQAQGFEESSLELLVVGLPEFNTAWQTFVVPPPPVAGSDITLCSLCQCAKMAALLILGRSDSCGSSRNNRCIRKVIAALEEERSHSLTKAKCLLEVVLFGPENLPLSEKNLETDLHKWLDLERAKALQSLKSKAPSQDSQFTKFNLFFLVKSNIRGMAEGLLDLGKASQ